MIYGVVFNSRYDPQSSIGKELNSIENNEDSPYSILKIVDGIDGVKLLALSNICYDIYHKSTYVYSEDESYLQNKHIPDSNHFFVFLISVFT